mgnify:CR=1 FL=1
MVFSSAIFLFAFLPVLYVVYRLAPGIRGKNVVLLLFSLLFYCFGSLAHLPVLLASILVNWGAGRVLGALDKAKKPARRAVMSLTAVIDIGLLAAYKYLGFFAGILSALTGLDVAAPALSMPLGISFFTFTGLGYVIEVYRKPGQMCRSLLKTALYIALFPNLLSGPILSWKQVAPQLEERVTAPEKTARGLRRFVLGLAKKLLVAQPSLTSAVQELEKELGFRLFYRTSRGVVLTAEGDRFLPYARAVEGQYQNLREEFVQGEKRRASFAVSTQHYSFAVKAFVETTQQADATEYELAIRETRTETVIRDVSTLRSEIGILYLSDFNRKALLKLLHSSGLAFHHLINCDAYVYLWKQHPLAKRERLTLDDLQPFPCLAFEQGDDPFYFSEELMSTEQYPRLIHCCDRATVLNLMVGLNGYTLCSGIICEELSGVDYIAIPFSAGLDQGDATMEIGYIDRKNNIHTSLGLKYIEEMKRYLEDARVGAQQA